MFAYNLEDIDKTDKGADVFNGQQSVLWKNVRAAFFEELKAMYQSLRSTGALSYDKVERMFEEHQAKWPEAIFNEDTCPCCRDQRRNRGSGGCGTGLSISTASTMPGIP